jgi:DNA-damage-inducible protein J
MSKTASLNIRLDAEIKKSAEAVYSHYGLSLAEAVTVFIHQSCNVGGLPFDLRPLRPNAESLEAMTEARLISRDPSIKGYRNVDDLFRDLDADE